MKTTNLFGGIYAVALGAIVTCIFSNVASSQVLDGSFGTGGKIITDFGSSTNDQAFSMAIQSDGKILVAGYSNTVGGGLDYDFALIRYNSDGSPDNSFDTDGKVTTVIGNYADQAKAIAIQADGKIVLAGETYDGSSFNFALVRYNTNGSLDNTFGLSGIMTTDFAADNDYGTSVAIQSDGKIIVAGRSWNGNNFDFALARYNSNSSLDNTFGTASGVLTTDFAGDDDYVTSVVIQADGKIIVAGYTFNGAENDFAAARYNTDGSLDNTFGTNGKLTTAFGSGDDFGNAVVLQSDNKIVIAGESYGDFALVRYNTDGTLDNTFGSGGKSITDFGSIEDDLRSVVIQTDGKMVVAGTTDIYDFALVRYNSNGSVDSSFALNGKANTDFISSNECYGYAVAIQGDSKYVIAGTTHNFLHDDFAIARFNAPVTAINSFNNQNSAVKIYPNPFTHSTKIEISDSRFSNGNLIIYDLMGREVHAQTLNSNKVNINVDLPGGMYFYKVSKEDGKGNSKEISNGRLLIQ